MSHPQSIFLLSCLFCLSCSEPTKFPVDQLFRKQMSFPATDQNAEVATCGLCLYRTRSLVLELVPLELMTSYHASLEKQQRIIRAQQFAKSRHDDPSSTSAEGAPSSSSSFSKCWMCDYVCTSAGYVNMPSLFVQRRRDRPPLLTGLTLCSVCASACNKPPGTALLDVVNAGHSTNACRTRSHSYVAFLREYKLIVEVLALELVDEIGREKIDALSDLGDKRAVAAVQRLMSCVDDTLSDGQSLKATERGILLQELARLQGHLELAARKQALRGLEHDRKRLSPGVGGSTAKQQSSVDLTSPARRYQKSTYYESLNASGISNTTSRSAGAGTNTSALHHAVDSISDAVGGPANQRTWSSAAIFDTTREIEALVHRPLFGQDLLVLPSEHGIAAIGGGNDGELMEDVLMAYFEGKIAELPLLTAPSTAEDVSKPLLPSQRIGVIAGDQNHRLGKSSINERVAASRTQSSQSREGHEEDPAARRQMVARSGDDAVAMHISNASKEFREFEVEHFRQVEEWRKERAQIQLRLEQERDQRRQLAEALEIKQAEIASLMVVNNELTSRVLSSRMDQTLQLHLQHLHAYSRLVVDRCAELAMVKASLFAVQAAAVVASQQGNVSGQSGLLGRQGSSGRRQRTTSPAAPSGSTTVF